MTTLNFPSSPILDDEYTFGSKTWVWNGSAWYLKQNQPLLILDLIKTVDGHNSGLDADLLDGNHASNYVTTTGTGASGNWNINITGSSATVTDGVYLNTSQTLTNKTITALKETKLSIPASNIDLNAGNFFTKTISGSTTFTLSNIASSDTVNSFILELTNAGSAAITWFSGVKWTGGTAPALTSSGIDILGFYTHNGGTTWRGMLLSKDNK